MYLPIFIFVIQVKFQTAFLVIFDAAYPGSEVITILDFD